jgi:hypothetical protein
VSNFVKSVQQISDLRVKPVFLTVNSAQWYVHNFVNFVSKHFGNMFVIMLELKNVRNKLESGLTYILLSLRMFRKLIVKPRLID